MDDKDKEEAEETESENLRDLILQQFSNLESSEASDDDSYKVRLSCILEDDESEGSGAAQKEFPKDVEKESKTNKENEKGPPEVLVAVPSEIMYDSEISDEFAGENLQITDLDDVTLCEKEKTENVSEETNDESEKNDGFAIKKLKSSDNLHKRPFVVRRRELSSDSSDLDISVTNSAEGPSSELKIVEMNEDDDENTLNITQDNVYVESETSADEDLDQKLSESREGGKGLELEVVDNETLAPIFAKVSRTYLEKTKSNVKWEENEKIDKVFRELIEEEVKRRGLQPGEHVSLQDVHIRGISAKEYNPPVPPETYLWEELKRLRERGGYPWTYLDKPPFDEATWKKYMEHVYEPINPPPLSAERKPETQSEINETQQPRGSSIPETEKLITKIPSKASLSKKDSMEESKTSEEMHSEGAQELQDRFESHFLSPTPTVTSETTASQSKTDVTSTVLDTSEFEDLPVKQGSLVKTRREQMRAQAAEIQQRLRNHAGRIRNKFSNMQRPSLKKKDRPKRETAAEKSRFKLPEMHAPRISLPDRSKFKFPEKAKLHLPESSKFHLPDRSKFHLPERPNFSGLAEKAKIHLSERKKFHLSDKSKFRLPEKSKFHLPEKAKLHLPDKSKFHLPEKAKFSLPNPPKLDILGFKKSVGSSEISPRTSKSRFDFDLKSYPKLFTKHSKEYTTSSPKQTRGRTPPPRMQQQEVPQTKKWTQKLDELKYMDDDLDEGEIGETDSRKSESLFEKDIAYMEDHDKVPTLSTKSSASRLSEISNDPKKGVLEEINPDEFFLRQKGISQDDIDMGQYLSREIREAFRSPDTNALAKMDYMDEDDENADPRKYRTEPKRPQRGTSGNKKSILKKTSTSDPSISEDGYKTYPPRRPGRKSRSQSKSLLNEEAIISESASRYETSDVNVSRYDIDDVNLSRYDNVEYDEDNLSEYYKTPGPAREYQHYKVPRSHVPICPSPPIKRKSSMEYEGSHKRIHEGWEEEFEFREPPKPMTRRKHKKKIKEQQLEALTPVVRELESFSEELSPQEIMKESSEAVLQLAVESPVPPKRTRTRSSGSRSLTSFATESDVNRSFHSEPGRDHSDHLEDEIIEEQRQILKENPLMMSSKFIAPKPCDFEVTDLDDPGFGYATVGKPTVIKPERHKKKPDRPPPPRKKKEISVAVYNTYPRRAPMRPLRNYSTLGPSRPPRQKKIPPVEKALTERQSKAYTEISKFDECLDLIEVSENSKDLQTKKVIEKMKGRPLPPPPRPPRQKSKGPEDELEPTEDEKLSLSILKDEEFPLERKVTVFVHEPPVDRETIEETCASTQTDPLLDDFSFGTEESSDVMPEFSHEQLKIQQAFLEEMKKEEEELRQKGTDENDLVDAELKAEVIRQIEDIIAEEKRILERKNEERIMREASEHGHQKEIEGRKPKDYLHVETDMGYASLERRGHRQERDAGPPELTSKMEKLQVKELEVESLNVHEVQSDQIFVKELQSNRIASPDIDNRGGTIALGSFDLPPSFIDQIVAKIPWNALRQTQELVPHQETLSTPPVRPQRRHRGSQAQDDSDEETLFQPRKSYRRQYKPQYSTDEEDKRTSKKSDGKTERRQWKTGEESNIPDLTLQLARACTSAGVQALRNFAQANATIAQSFDRELCVQAILCIAIALIAGFFLFGFDAKIVHLHRWDFQFPPQPPNAGF